MAETSSLETQLQEARQETELTLLQLHQVQEEDYWLDPWMIERVRFKQRLQCRLLILT